jgi:hypothetical protein
MCTLQACVSSHHIINLFEVISCKEYNLFIKYNFLSEYTTLTEFWVLSKQSEN